MASPKSIFDKTIDRAIKQIALYRKLSDVSLKKPDMITDDLSDLIRTALVLGVSALDAYFTNKFVEKLVPYLQKKGPTDGIVDIVNKAWFNTKVALEMLPKDRNKRPYRKLRTLVEQYLEKFVTQKFDTIDDLFLSMSLKDLCKNAEKKSKRINLCRRIEIAIEWRHKIVHKGDLNDHGNLCTITDKDTEKRLKEIKLFVEKCDEIINSRIK